MFTNLITIRHTFLLRPEGWDVRHGCARCRNNATVAGSAAAGCRHSINTQMLTQRLSSSSPEPPHSLCSRGQDVRVTGSVALQGSWSLRRTFCWGVDFLLSQRLERRLHLILNSVGMYLTRVSWRQSRWLSSTFILPQMQLLGNKIIIQLLQPAIS